jgi:hypothetical protein
VTTTQTVAYQGNSGTGGMVVARTTPTATWQTPAACSPRAQTPFSPYAATASIAPLLKQLRQSVNPFDREAAVNCLVRLPGRPTLEVIATLKTSASEDSAAIVRVACLHGLAVLRVADPSLAPLAKKARTDADPRVRMAASELDAWVTSLVAPPAETPRTVALTR